MVATGVLSFIYFSASSLGNTFSPACNCATTSFGSTSFPVSPVVPCDLVALVSGLPVVTAGVATGAVDADGMPAISPSNLLNVLKIFLVFSHCF